MQGQPQKALDDLLAISDSTNLSNIPRQKILWEECMSDAYEQMGDHDNALTHFKNCHELYKSFHDEEKSRTVARLEARYKNEKLERESLAFQMKALRSQMNPHFIFNSLNAIQGYVALGNVDDAQQFISRFSLLMRDTLEHSEGDFILLRDEIEFLENYLILERARFESRFEFEFIPDPAIDIQSLRIPSMMIQPLLEDVVANQLMGQGKVAIEFDAPEPEELRCRIDFSAASSSQHSSKAKVRKTLEERMRLFNRRHQLTLKLEESDLPEGSRLELRLPLR